MQRGSLCPSSALDGSLWAVVLGAPRRDAPFHVVAHHDGLLVHPAGVLLDRRVLGVPAVGLLARPSRLLLLAQALLVLGRGVAESDLVLCHWSLSSVRLWGWAPRRPGTDWSARMPPA